MVCSVAFALCLLPYCKECRGSLLISEGCSASVLGLVPHAILNLCHLKKDLKFFICMSAFPALVCIPCLYLIFIETRGGC